MNVDFDQQDIIIELPPEGKDGRSIHPAGEWSADAEYHTLDLVSYQGSSYIAERSVPAGTLPTDAEYWQVVAEKGASEWGNIAGNIADQTDLQDALNSKADVGTSYTKSEEDALLAQKANASEVYTKTETDSLLSDKADVGDSYTKAEEDALLAGKANASDVYTKAQVDTLLEAKADTADLGTLAGKDSVDYQTEVTNKPTLGTMALVNDAPSDNKQYARKNGQWAEVQGGGGGGSAEWGAITGDLSDQTDLADALLDKAPVILNSASGSIASFSDGSASPVTALSVAIDPVQDLHGYDNPWPAGGGKNKLPNALATMTLQGIQYVKQANGTYLVSGTHTGSNNSDIYFNSADGSGGIGNGILLPAGEYKFSGISGGSQSTFRLYMAIYESTTRYVGLNDGESSFTLSEATYVGMFIRIYAGVAISTLTVYPMIRLASVSDATFAPYENICPISGHDTATVTRTGKNLCYEVLPNVINLDADIPRVGTAAGTTACFKAVKGQTYIVSGGTGRNRGNIGYFDSAPVEGSRSNFAVQHPSAKTPDGFIFTALRTAYCTCYLANSILPNVNIQIELGSTATAYEPYQGQQVTIDLDGTRYGGVLDVLTGTMTVDRVKWIPTIDYTPGTNTYGITNWRFPGSNFNNTSAIKRNNISNWFTYQETVFADTSTEGFTISNTGVGYIRLKAEKATTVAEANTWVASNDFYMVLYLAEPLTVQLTPFQMQTLLGTNNIWSDTGDTSVEYRADTKLFVQGQIAETAKVTRQMIADSATADGKAPKSLAAGDLIIVGDELRKATANIGNGSAITASNSTIATLADVIKALQ